MSTKTRKPYKVRVLRQMEDWVEVLALSSEEAEEKARTLPGVVELRGVTILAERRPGERKVGVEDPGEED